MRDIWLLVWHVRSMAIFTPTISKKMNKQKSAVLLRSVREVISQGKLLLPVLERQTSRYRESQLTGTETHKQIPLQEPVPGQERAEL